LSNVKSKLGIYMLVS